MDSPTITEACDLDDSSCMMIRNGKAHDGSEAARNCYHVIPDVASLLREDLEGSLRSPEWLILAFGIGLIAALHLTKGGSIVPETS